MEKTVKIDNKKTGPTIMSRPCFFVMEALL